MTVTHTLETPTAARARSRTLETDAGWTQTQRLQMYHSHAELQAQVSCRTMPGLCGTSVIFRLAVKHMHALMDLYTHTNFSLYNSTYSISQEQPFSIKLKMSKSLNMTWE